MTSYYHSYRHLAFEPALPAPAPADIAAIEAELGAALPASLLDFLQAANGAVIEYSCNVPLPDGGSEQLSFASWFAAGDPDTATPGDETLLGELRLARQDLEFPALMLPLARDGGDSMLYLDLSAEGGGRVLAWVRELPAWTGRRAQGLHQLAPSLDAYLNQLYIDRASVLDDLAHSVRQPSHLEAIAQWLDIGLPRWRTDPEIAALFERRQQQLCAGVQDQSYPAVRERPI